MITKTLDSKGARNNWREMLDLVAIRHTEVVITRYNKPVAAVVPYDDYLAVRSALLKHRAARRSRQHTEDEALATMLASESVLAREWDTPEEDAAWADL